MTNHSQPHNLDQSETSIVNCGQLTNHSSPIITHTPVYSQDLQRVCGEAGRAEVGVEVGAARHGDEAGLCVDHELVPSPGLDAVHHLQPQSYYFRFLVYNIIVSLA